MFRRALLAVRGEPRGEVAAGACALPLLLLLLPLLLLWVATRVFRAVLPLLLLPTLLLPPVLPAPLPVLLLLLPPSGADGGAPNFTAGAELLNPPLSGALPPLPATAAAAVTAVSTLSPATWMRAE